MVSVSSVSLFHSFPCFPDQWVGKSCEITTTRQSKRQASTCSAPPRPSSSAVILPDPALWPPTFPFSCQSHPSGHLRSQSHFMSTSQHSVEIKVINP